MNQSELKLFRHLLASKSKSLKPSHILNCVQKRSHDSTTISNSLFFPFDVRENFGYIPPEEESFPSALDIQ